MTLLYAEDWSDLRLVQTVNGWELGGYIGACPVKPEVVGSRVRFYAAVGLNEKLVGLWKVAEPPIVDINAGFGRAYGDGYEHLFIRYEILLPSSMIAGMNPLSGGAKLPGPTGTYDISARQISPPSPPPSSAGTWEGRLWIPVFDQAKGGWPLSVYYYGVFDPRGHPASLAKYDGSGNPNGPLPTTGLIVPDVATVLEVEVRVNTVKDKAFFTSAFGADGHPKPSAEVDADILACQQNANKDGVLRIRQDGKLIADYTTCGFRGMDFVRIQSVPFLNVYEGGHGNYPLAPHYVEIGPMSVSTEETGGGMTPEEQALVDQALNVATLAADHYHDLKDYFEGSTPPPPQPQTIDSFTATPTHLPPGGGAATLSWATTNATAVLLDKGGVNASGSAIRQVVSDTDFTLQAFGPAPVVTRTLTVTVAQSPSGGGTVLADLVASMKPDSWALVNPMPANMETALFDPVALAGGNENGILPYGAATNAGYILGGDHMGVPKFVRYDEPTNAFFVLEESTLGSHPYQNTWYPWKVLTGRPVDQCGLYKWDGTLWNKVAALPENVTQYIPAAICVWNGKPIWYSGNSGILYAFNEKTATWTPFAEHPDQVGIQSSVSCPTPAGVVFGGGHSSGSQVWLHGRELYLSDGVTRTRMQDAPFDMGIEAGQLTGNGKGKVMLVGFGQAWELDPATGVVTRRADPPPGMSQPNPRPGFTNNLMSWEAIGYTVYVQYDRTATPKTAMYVYKPA